MKTKILIRSLLFFLGAATLVTCKRIQPGAGVVTIIDGSFSKATASFQFVDAKTGTLLDVNGNEKIKVAIYGKNAADVVDNLGGKNLGTASGFLAIALNEGVLPSTTAPTEFTVHATANGYLPADVQVTLVQEGHRHLIVSMVKVSDTPDGVSAKQGALPVVPSSGITTGSTTFSPNPVTATGTTAIVNISAGTKLMDKDNATVSGNVSYTLAYFNPVDNKALQNFPGGMLNSKTTDNKNVFFNTLGWISMELTGADGTAVKKFGQAIQTTISIPTGAKKIDGTLLTNGNTLKVYSYDEALAAWKYESDVVVKQNDATGKLEASFEMTHLSTWQVTDPSDFIGSSSFTKTTMLADCPDYFKTTSDIKIKALVNVMGNTSEEEEAAAMISLDERNPIFLQSAVVGVPITIEYIYWRKDFPNDVVTFNPRSSNVVKFPSSWCPPEPAKEFEIVLETSCPDNPSRKIRPQCFVTALEVGKTFSDIIVLGEMKEGVLKSSTATLKKGKKYAILAMYQGKFVALTGKLANPFDFGSVTIDGNKIDLSRPLTDDECSYLRKTTG